MLIKAPCLTRHRVTHSEDHLPSPAQDMPVEPWPHSVWPKTRKLTEAFLHKKILNHDQRIQDREVIPFIDLGTNTDAISA